MLTPSLSKRIDIDNDSDFLSQRMQLSLNLFTIFHLNLAYSSIEEEQRPQVIQRCYWPLLRLARRYGLPFGIEASGYTLESVAEIDRSWIDELRSLTTQGPCEFVGSGYAQIIGPLAPAEVNAANLRLGNEAYRELLGFRPAIALVNEQAYSAGLLQHYKEAGYKAIVMEWDNPARWHPDWNREWRYFPQVACGQHGEELPVIWNKSIAFQKFQRYAHGEMDLSEYLNYVATHVGPEDRAFPLYGNDVEVFDFRPGRYQTEPVLKMESEWERIDALFQQLLADERYRLIPPNQVLGLLSSPGAGHRLHLETSQDPVPVKKQEKYNLNRWAVTGRNDLAINTACRRIYEVLRKHGPSDERYDDRYWRELCYLWSSDFRTHITEKRWLAFLDRLRSFEDRLGIHAADRPVEFRPSGRAGTPGVPQVAGFDIKRQSRWLSLETDAMKAVFNCRRGLAIDSLTVKRVSERPLLGTIPHGYYQDIALGADFYSGHLILETPGRPKVTDLEPVEPEVCEGDQTGVVMLRGCVKTSLGPVLKTIWVTREGQIRLRFELQWEQLPVGLLRLGHVTLHPEAFDPESLFFETHNGGVSSERFAIEKKGIEHGRSVSFLVSSSSSLGMTGGALKMGDRERAIEIRTALDQACVVAQITYVPVQGSFFYRASFSAAELDDTCRDRPRLDFPRVLEFTISARKEVE
jgi:Glycosyl hydrolase family 57